MSSHQSHFANFPPSQQLLHAKCFHPGETYDDPLDFDFGQSVSQRFESIVARYPNRTAIELENEILSYAELNRRADQIARELNERDEGGQEPVGVCLPNGAGLLAVIVGIWKSQRTFALFDPLSPKDRLATLVTHSQAKLIYIGKRAGMEMAPCPRAELIDSHELGVDNTQTQSTDGPACSANAAIFYTSGSTGTPKGVIATHANLLHQTMLFANGYRLCLEDRIALLSAGSSSAVTSALIALLNGATLLPFDVRNHGTTQLARWLAERRISICMLGAPLFRSLAHALTGHERFPDLRLIRLRSETVLAKDLDLFKNLFPKHCLLVNGLSSTESGLLTLCFFDHQSTINGEEMPVGYAVSDKEVSLLGIDGESVGFDSVGEIVVKSRYLTPGYWRDPKLTAAKFEKDPDGTDKRMYHSGDLAIRRADGCLIYKGRKDSRVKIRGYGVDLAEVERTLRDHCTIKDAIVVARQNKLSEQHLVAYFTAHDLSCPNGIELRTFLKSKLPDYMVPAKFVILADLPLTPNGKIDRRALPEPGDHRPNLATAFTAPNSSVEVKLSRIWSEVLHIDEIGIHDNLFELGGHSLAATRIVSRVVKDFALEIRLQDFLASPTIASMAWIIEKHQSNKIGDQEIARHLAEVEGMTEKDAERLLSMELRPGKYDRDS